MLCLYITSKNTFHVAVSQSALLEHPTWSSLPRGLPVEPSLIDLPSQPPYKVSVMLKNEPERDVVVPSKCVLAELSAIQTVLSPQPCGRYEFERSTCVFGRYNCFLENFGGT